MKNALIVFHRWPNAAWVHPAWGWKPLSSAQLQSDPEIAERVSWERWAAIAYCPRSMPC